MPEMRKANEKLSTGHLEMDVIMQKARGCSGFMGSGNYSFIKRGVL
jgi:hypothetical protein